MWNNDLNSVSLLEHNRWHYITFRFDKTNLTKSIYIDGKLDATSSSNAYIGTGTNTILFSPFSGRFAKFEAYNRALQPQEINQNYMANKDRILRTV